MIKITYTFPPHAMLEVSKIPSFHKNKTPCPCMTPLSLKICQGYGAIQKEKNKRCIPKEGMPHASACQKKEERK